MCYVYILYSKKSLKRYIGVTTDLKKRLKKHNNGSLDYTKKGRLWMLIYYQAFMSKRMHPLTSNT